MYNDSFDREEFEEILKEAGLSRFIMSVKQWVERTHLCSLNEGR